MYINTYCTKPNLDGLFKSKLRSFLDIEKSLRLIFTISTLKLGKWVSVENTVFPINFQRDPPWSSWRRLKLRPAQLSNCRCPHHAAAANNMFPRSTHNGFRYSANVRPPISPTTQSCWVLSEHWIWHECSLTGFHLRPPANQQPLNIGRLSIRACLACIFMFGPVWGAHLGG